MSGGNEKGMGQFQGKSSRLLSFFLREKFSEVKVTVTPHGFMSFRFTGKVDVDDPAPLVLIGGSSPPPS
jgi:hypothetical protein